MGAAVTYPLAAFGGPFQESASSLGFVDGNYKYTKNSYLVTKEFAMQQPYFIYLMLAKQ